MGLIPTGLVQLLLGKCVIVHHEMRLIGNWACLPRPKPDQDGTPAALGAQIPELGLRGVQ